MEISEKIHLEFFRLELTKDISCGTIKVCRVCLSVFIAILVSDGL